MEETNNSDLARKLRVLADRLEARPDLQVSVTRYVWSKEEAQKIIRDIGGKWTKQASGSEMNAWIELTSLDTGLVIHIPRDKVCKRTVTYQCEPLLSPEEEAELIAPEEREAA